MSITTRFITNIYISCVYGWGWTQSFDQYSEPVCIDEYPTNIEANTGLLCELNGFVRFIQIKNAKSDFSIGQNIIIYPSHSDEPVSSGEFHFARLRFGDNLISNSYADIAIKADKQLYQFNFPETIGFADIVRFKLEP
ncbi:MAG: hypothetical protein ACFUZC_18990 [Chthoniobacteraceae bacterium]